MVVGIVSFTIINSPHTSLLLFSSSPLLSIRADKRNWKLAHHCEDSEANIHPFLQPNRVNLFREEMRMTENTYMQAMRKVITPRDDENKEPISMF